MRAADIPTPLLHAFVDALEAWGLLEHELFMVWQLLNGSPDIGKAWDKFSWWSTAKQREKTIALVERFRSKTDYAPRIPEIFDRLIELATKRNRIVHGHWHPIELVVGGKTRGTEYIRLYDARNVPCCPVDIENEKRMLGRSRFYESDLKEAERQFRVAARDVHLAKAAMIRAWRKWIA